MNDQNGDSRDEIGFNTYGKYDDEDHHDAADAADTAADDEDYEQNGFADEII